MLLCYYLKLFALHLQTLQLQETSKNKIKCLLNKVAKKNINMKIFACYLLAISL